MKKMKMRTGLGSKRAVVFLFLCLSLSSFPTVQLQLNQDVNESAATRILKQVGDGVHEVHCSRERSRAAWKIIEEYLMPFVEREHFLISPACRLHPDNDLYRDQEQHKFHLDANEWECGYCKKKFYEEKYLDKHFDNRHYNLLNVSNGRCLADMCGALHCDLVMESTVHKAKCNPAAATKNQHLCESLANSCFPVNAGPSASRLHEFFLCQFCDAHTCTGNRKPFSKGRRQKGGQIMMVMKTTILCFLMLTLLMKQTNMSYLAISIFILMLVPLFYVFVYLYQRGIKCGTQELKRISHSQSGRKKKPY